MDSKSPKGRKRISKTTVGMVENREDDGCSLEQYWDCSVCTFRNHGDAFKCSMCDVRKGTSTRKPRINPDLVAAQQAQAITPLTITSNFDEADMDNDASSFVFATGKAKKSSKDKKSRKCKENKKNIFQKARLKNVDRTSATYHSVTVNDVTVVITEFQPKGKKEKKTKSNKLIAHGCNMNFEEKNLIYSNIHSEHINL